MASERTIEQLKHKLKIASESRDYWMQRWRETNQKLSKLRRQVAGKGEQASSGSSQMKANILGAAQLRLLRELTFGQGPVHRDRMDQAIAGYLVMLKESGVGSPRFFKAACEAAGVEGGGD